jgi:hypothetical protein
MINLPTSSNPASGIAASNVEMLIMFSTKKIILNGSARTVVTGTGIIKNEVKQLLRHGKNAIENNIYPT